MYKEDYADVLAWSCWVKIKSNNNKIFLLLLLLDGRKGYSSLRLPLSFVYKNWFFVVCWVDELPITQEKYLSLYRFLIRR